MKTRILPNGTKVEELGESVIISAKDGKGGHHQGTPLANTGEWNLFKTIKLKDVK